MALETAIYINTLDAANPPNSDPKAQGAAHLRMIKSAVKATFPNVAGAVNATHTELNFVAGATSSLQAQITSEIADRVADVNAEESARIAVVNAEESARIAAVNAEAIARGNADALLAPKASPTFTGTVTMPVTVGTFDAARKDYVDAIAFSSALPGQAGNAGKFVTTDGTSASWVAPAQTPEIITPTNVSPANAATVATETPTLTGSAFYSLYGATQSAIQVQVSTSTSFTSPLYSSGDQAVGISFTLPGGIVSVSTGYYWRLRYKNSRGTYSDWSTAFSFTTAAAFNSYITTPTATPAAFGDAFEGGFYSGMIWNELVQSATSFTIGTGSKAFTVPSMSGAAIVYAGQTLEMRSRANPANKMIGTVTGAIGTTLTINVTSVGGSGTFADWSIMSRYRIIKAPKSSGESASLAYKNSNDAAPAACGTLTEGRKATLAMVAAGSATVYPAAHFCNNLTIGGRTDWYLGARDENELDWRDLKPTADNNYTTADRPTGATPDYKNLGSYGDTASTHGLNNNSSPTGAAYTATVPGQVASGKNFRTGESEAFEYGAAYYWSASEYSAAYAWLQAWGSSNPGYQNGNGGKTGAYRVRAVRRSII